MPKIRIYELAKQIDVSSREIIDQLNVYGKSVNNHMASLEDVDVKRLTNDLKPPKRAPAPPAQNSQPGDKADMKPDTRMAENRPPRPEGEERPMRPRPEGDRPLRPRPEGDRPLRPRPEGERPLRPRPEGDRPLRPRPEGERPLRPRPEGERLLRPRPSSDGEARPNGERPLRPRPEGERPLRPRLEGERPLRPRPEGERPLRPRPEGERPLRPRPEGERPLRPRPEGERPLRPRPEGERPLRPRPEGERPLRPRPEGERPLRPRPEGERPLRPRLDSEGEARPIIETTKAVTPHQNESSELRPQSMAESNIINEHLMHPRQEEREIKQINPTSAPIETENKKTVSQPPETPPAKQDLDTPRSEKQLPNENQPPRVDSPGRNDRPRNDTPRYDNRPRTDAPRTDNRPRTDAPRNDNRPRTDAPRTDNRPRSDAPRTDNRPRSDAPRTDNRPRTDAPRTDNRPRTDAPRGEYRPRTDAPRPGGFVKSGPRTDATGTPYRSGSGGGVKPDSGTRPWGQGRPQGQGRPGQSGPRPEGQGGSRPGGFKPGFPKKDDGKGGFARPAARPVFGAKKDDKKVAEPTKDDRKQDWKKNEQMRTVKSKDNVDADKKENKQFLNKKEGFGKKGQGKKAAPFVAKRIMPKKIEPEITMITVSTEITVRELAEKLHKSNADIIKILMQKGIMATANQTIDFDTAVIVAEHLNILVAEYVEVDVFEEAFAVKPDNDVELMERPPVVVVMGHVDHGKTSLLDVIRDASVQQTEAGGITQHIGAYTVTINGKPITFLDTPGHEAFTAMRMRGAQVTDIAVLVVAANDGVMPQTVEAINHAKAAGVDIIVAINKVDLPSANPDRVKQELTEYGLLVEDWGGETIAVPVSALKKTGIEQLLEMIIIVSEMKELRANPNKPARGSIIEAKLDKQRGPVATVLVQDGTLRIGDPIVVGPCFGKIRAMVNDKGANIREAGPSIPVEIIGLSEVPSAGDTFYVATDEKQARQLSESVIAKGRESMIKVAHNKVSLDDLFNQIQAGNVKELNIIVKADVQGSVEALKSSLDKLSNDQVRVRIIHGGVGAITESDVMLASASNAIIIGFNVRPEPVAKTVADTEKVDVRMYRVIYSAIDDITAALKGMLDPEFREKILGHAEIRQLFKASGVGTIGGSYVTDGKITRSAKVRIIRDGRVVYDGTLETLKRFKDDVREVASGYECGLLFNRFNDIKENDRVEAYAMEEIPR